MRSLFQPSPSRTELAWLLIILLVAAFFRLWRLESVPPGLTHDEANNVHDAMAVLDGVRPLYFPVAQGKEPLYPYSVAALMSLLGRSPWTMRLTSAAWSLSLILLTFIWTRRAFGPTVALLTAAGLAAGFWPVTTGRMGLRAITLPVLFTAAIWFLWRGMEEGANQRGSESARERVSEVVRGRGGGWIHYALAGLALGASMYTYLAARVMPLVLGLFFVYMLSQRRLAWGVLLALAVAAVVAVPLFSYLAAHPSAEIRIGQLDQPLHALLRADPVPLFDRLRETLPMLSFQGDTFIPYNIPGKPLLGPVMSVLFYAGLALALWRWRRPACALVLLWLVVGLGPALVTGIEAVNLRAIAAQPVVYLFPALSLQALGRRVGLGRRPSPNDRSPTEPKARGGWKLSRRPLMVLGCVVLFAGVAVLTYRDYFVRWAQDRDVRVHYHAHLGAIADYVAAHPAQTFVISALYPGQYHDPCVVEAALGGGGAHLRWADGRGAWVLPAGGAADQAVTFIVPTAVPLAPELASALPPSVAWAEQVSLRPDDFSPAFEVYRWRDEAAPAGPPLAQLGDQLRLLGAELPASRVAPGEVLEFLTTWQVADVFPADRDAVLFAQVLDAAGNVVAQQDRLDAPSWNWHPGDRFMQLLRLPLPADLAPGSYRLILGAYTVPDRVDAVLAGHEPDPSNPRLPVVSDGAAGGGFIELPSIEVVGDG